MVSQNFIITFFCWVRPRADFTNTKPIINVCSYCHEYCMYELRKTYRIRSCLPLLASCLFTSFKKQEIYAWFISIDSTKVIHNLPCLNYIGKGLVQYHEYDVVAKVIGSFQIENFVQHTRQQHMFFCICAVWLGVSCCTFKCCGSSSCSKSRRAGQQKWIHIIIKWCPI